MTARKISGRTHSILALTSMLIARPILRSTYTLTPTAYVINTLAAVLITGPVVRPTHALAITATRTARSTVSRQPIQPVEAVTAISVAGSVRSAADKLAAASCVFTPSTVRASTAVWIVETSTVVLVARSVNWAARGEAGAANVVAASTDSETAGGVTEPVAAIFVARPWVGAAVATDGTLNGRLPGFEVGRN